MEHYQMGSTQHGRGLSGRRPALRFLVMPSLFALVAGTTVKAQSVTEQLREMRQAIQDLQQQVKTLREQLRETQGALARTEPIQVASRAMAPIPPDPPSSVESSSSAIAPAAAPASAQTEEASAQEATAVEKIPLLESEIADLAQVKVESNSRFPVKIFGTIVSDAAFNSAGVNWLDDPEMPVSEPTGGAAPRSFSMSLRQSRLGAIVNGPTLGTWKTSGLVVMDFFGGSTALAPDTIMPVPRLLYGYARLERGRTAIEFGQDQMILAPQDPTSIAALAFPDLYLAGNLYSRAAQARVEQTFATGKSGEFVATAGLLDTDSSDANTVAQLTPSGWTNETVHRPAGQARLAWKWHAGDSKRFEIGASGHRGSERLPYGSAPSWAGALDFNAQDGRLGIAGEWYAGRNLAAFGGAIGQFAKSTGGFGEVRLKATRRLSFNSGYGSDHLFDLRAFPAPFLRNSGAYLNTIYQFTPELAGSVEYRWLSLVPAAGAVQGNNHLDFVLAYSF
jgi:hypothetical protein